MCIFHTTLVSLVRTVNHTLKIFAQLWALSPPEDESINASRNFSYKMLVNHQIDLTISRRIWNTKKFWSLFSHFCISVLDMLGREWSGIFSTDGINGLITVSNIEKRSGMHCQWHYYEKASEWRSRQLLRKLYMRAFVVFHSSLQIQGCAIYQRQWVW